MGRPKERKTRPSEERDAAAALFGHAIQVTGLSHADLAAHLGISIQSVRGYATGRTRPKDATMTQIARLVEIVVMRQPIPLGFVLPPAAAARKAALDRIRRREWPRPTLPTTRLNPHPQGEGLDDNETEEIADGDEG